MKPKPIIMMFAILALVLISIAGGCRHRRVDRARAYETSGTDERIAPSDATVAGKDVANALVAKGGEDVDFSETEEVRRAYRLTPGAKVNINNINGRIDVETAETDIAEVLIIRSAKKRDDLQFHKLNISHEPAFLRINVENDRKSAFSALGSIPEGRQRVILRLPRKVEFKTYGLNGNLTVGEIDGTVNAGGVNGAVNIAQATGAASFHGINGNVAATIARLSGEGIDLSSLNGNTELRFIGEVNASVEAFGMNGKVEPDLPNVEVEKSDAVYKPYKARIGNGRVRIRVRGVNGNVYLGKAEKTGEGSPKAADKGKELRTHTVGKKLRTFLSPAGTK